MKQHLIVSTAILTLCTVSPSVYPFSAGGYDVTKIVDSTVEVLKAKEVVLNEDALAIGQLANDDSKTDPLIAGNSTIEIYKKLGNILVSKKIVTELELAAVNDLAAKSGGLKIAGENPVVLAAAYLNLMSQKGLISITQAQQILNDSKNSKSK